MHGCHKSRWAGTRTAAHARVVAVVLCIALLAVVPSCLTAQRVVPSKSWSPAAADGSVDIYLRSGATLSPRVAALVSRNNRLFQRVIGFRADSLILGLGVQDAAGTFTLVDSATVAASAIDSVNVWRQSRGRARRATGGETAIYTGLLGAIIGAVAGGRGERWKGAGIGAGASAAVGFAWGFARPYSGYESYREIITLRVER